MTMSGCDVLRRPSPGDHLVQTYTDDRHLATVVAEYVQAGLDRQEAAVLILTPTHAELVTAGLTARGIDVAAALAARRLLVLDARLTLARLLVDGAVDRERFVGVVGAALRHVRSSERRGVRLFGEMVELLRHHSIEATVALERLWSDTLLEERVCLLCAYRMDPFERQAQPVLRQVTHCHSHVLPMEHPDRFARAVSDAYAEVFGIGADHEVLRRLMVGSLSLSTMMAEPVAALLALGDMPPVIADDIRVRAQRLYSRAA
jgi:hypothetical protein